MLFEFSKTCISRVRQVACCETMQLNESNMFKQLKYVIEIFSEKLSNNLNTHDQIKHFTSTKLYLIRILDFSSNDSNNFDTSD